MAGGSKRKRSNRRALGAVAAAGAVGAVGLAAAGPVIGVPEVTAEVSRIARVAAEAPFASDDWAAGGSAAALAALATGLGSVVLIRRYAGPAA